MRPSRYLCLISDQLTAANRFDCAPLSKTNMGAPERTVWSEIKMFAHAEISRARMFSRPALFWLKESFEPVPARKLQANNALTGNTHLEAQHSRTTEINTSILLGERRQRNLPFGRKPVRHRPRLRREPCMSPSRRTLCSAADCFGRYGAEKGKLGRSALVFLACQNPRVNKQGLLPLETCRCGIVTCLLKLELSVLAKYACKSISGRHVELSTEALHQLK